MNKPVFKALICLLPLLAVSPAHAQAPAEENTAQDAQAARIDQAKADLLNTAMGYFGFKWLNTRSRADYCKTKAGVDITPFVDEFNKAHAPEDAKANQIVDIYWKQVYPEDETKDPLEKVWLDTRDEAYGIVKRDMQGLQQNRHVTLERLCNWFNEDKEAIVQIYHLKTRNPTIDRIILSFEPGQEE